MAIIVCFTHTHDSPDDDLPKNTSGRYYVVENLYEQFSRGPDVWGYSEGPILIVVLYQAQALYGSTDGTLLFDHQCSRNSIIYLIISLRTFHHKRD